ncbi:LADA_0D06920g1_1 [Lachancea dasiensis]|uniref:LADA_0D06920g1_1 n=1 Tax=Lachancea dasiensis TaxID=1072105 RepID=A0A1G4J658_9SACH|nr:LADA_0D06920g1_1 [Lachancea dasiensis]
MGLGIHRKTQKVPDLSRYDYHYQNKADTVPGNGLSTAAAAASAGRSRSLVYSNSPQGRPQSAGSRSYSLRNSGSMGLAPKSSSERLSSLARKTSQQTTPRRMSSRTNSMITVHTTEVKDPMGRTQSITKKTVRRINGYEYVETTTSTSNPVGPQDADNHFSGFTTDFSDDFAQAFVQDEPEDMVVGSRISSTLREEDEDEDEDEDKVEDEDEDKVEDEEDEYDEANFSDAIDYFPQSNGSNRSGGKVARPAKNPGRPKRLLSEQEQYAKALEAAQKKVYGDRLLTQSPDLRVGNPTMRRMSSLREPAIATPAIPQSRRRSVSQKVSRISQHGSTTTSDPEPSLGMSAAHKENLNRRHMSDDEMYAKALEIARQKYSAEGVASNSQPKIRVSSGKENGSKFNVKSFFNRVAQFSQDNYGYQNRKSSSPQKAAKEKGESLSEMDLNEFDDHKDFEKKVSSVEGDPPASSKNVHRPLKAAISLKPTTNGPGESRTEDPLEDTGELTTVHEGEIDTPTNAGIGATPDVTLEDAQRIQESDNKQNLVDGPSLIGVEKDVTGTYDKQSAPTANTFPIGSERLPQGQPTVGSSIPSSQTSFTRRSLRGSSAGLGQDSLEPNTQSEGSREVVQAPRASKTGRKSNFLQKLFARKKPQR